VRRKRKVAISRIFSIQSISFVRALRLYGWPSIDPLSEIAVVGDDWLPLTHDGGGSPRAGSFVCYPRGNFVESIMRLLD